MDGTIRRVNTHSGTSGRDRHRPFRLPHDCRGNVPRYPCKARDDCASAQRLPLPNRDKRFAALRANPAPVAIAIRADDAVPVQRPAMHARHAGVNHGGGMDVLAFLRYGFGLRFVFAHAVPLLLSVTLRYGARHANGGGALLRLHRLRLVPALLLPRSTRSTHRRSPNYSPAGAPTPNAAPRQSGTC